MKTTMKRFCAVIMALAIMLSLFSTVSFAAADVPAATIDADALGSIDIYKYDLTRANKELTAAEVAKLASYVSTGQRDTAFEDLMVDNDHNDFNPNGNGSDVDAAHQLGNGQTSNGLAIKGVEFKYLKIANIIQYSETEASGVHKEMLLYEMDDVADAALLTALGLTNSNAYDVQSVAANGATAFQPVSGKHYFLSDTLIDALATRLASNSTTVKNALEAYMADQNASAFPETDSNGHTSVSDLPLGLYLVVETRVPEMVTSTTDPFFVSVPSVSVDGTLWDGTSVDGGSAWLYNVVLYPKNNTGIPTMEMTIRESARDTGSVEDVDATWHDNNNGSPIDDGYAHNATASDGDMLNVQDIVHLPSITSDATALSNLSWVFTMGPGMEFDGFNIPANLSASEAVQEFLRDNYDPDNVVIEIFKDAECTAENKIATWRLDDAAPKFSVAYAQLDAAHGNATTQTVTVNAAGLAAINSGAAQRNASASLEQGYSSCYLRIMFDVTMNQSADVVYGDDGNYLNVDMTWKRTNESYYDSLSDDVHVYTYGLILTKSFEDGNGDPTAVKFRLFNKTDAYWVTGIKYANGIYYVGGTTVVDGAATDIVSDDTPSGFVFGFSDDDMTTGSVSATDESGAKGTIFVPDSNGHLEIRSLEDDEYIVTEIETDNGYTLLADNINFIITAADDDTRPCAIYTQDANGVWQNKYTGTIVSWAGTPYEQNQLAHNMLTASATVAGDPTNMSVFDNSASVDAAVTMSVINHRGYDFPVTGDSGNWMYPAAAAALVALAICVLFVVFRKKEQKD